MRTPETPAAGGFTLVEVLVALTILSIGVMALFHVRGESVRNAAALEDRALAQIVAENRLIETTRLGAPLVIGTREGITEMASREWEWSEEVAETPNANMRRIEVSVRMAEGENILAGIVGFRNAN